MGPAIVLAGTAFLLGPGDASAQVSAPACHPFSPTERVVVTMTDGNTIQGTLLCLSDEAARLLRDGQAVDTPLSGVTRIRTQADPAWDGAVKGAAIPLIMWSIFSHDGESLPWTLRSAAAWAVIGGTWDALQTNKKTIYSGGPRSMSMAWRVRF
jgi:hypothetical protein